MEKWDLFHVLDSGILVLDSELRIEQINSWLYLRLKKDPEEFIGKPLLEVFPELDRKRVIRNLRSVQKFGNTVFLPAKSIGHLIKIKNRPPNSRYSEWMHQNCRMGGLKKEGKVEKIFITLEDATEILWSQQKLESSLAELEEVKKARELFLSNMSHELRTPLNGVLGTLRSLHEEGPDEIQEQLADGMQSAEHLFAMVNDILDYSKLIADQLTLEVQPFDLNQLIGEVHKLVKSWLKDKPLGLDFHNHSIALELLGDEERIKQILLNVLKNSVEFTDKGQIFLGFSVYPIHDEIYQLVITIRDTGCGISEKRLATILDGFEQENPSMNREHGGAGLGLTLSHLLAMRMDGHLEILSQEGVWTEVNIILELKGYKADSNELPSGKILVVDDNLMNRKLLGKILQNNGQEVEFAENGLKAVEAAKANCYDVVFMDLQMPVMNGLEASKILLSENPNIVIVAVTANDTLQSKEQVLSLGVRDYLTKPFKPIQLVEVLRKFL